MINFKLKPAAIIALRYLFPTQCALCKQYCEKTLCHNCFTNQLSPNTYCCERCANPLAPLLHSAKPSSRARLCGQCISKPPPYINCIAPYIYENGIRELTHQLKFSANFTLAQLFAHLLQTPINDYIKQRGPLDTIVPIPLHPSRLRERGYNQTQQLAKALAKQHELTIINSLSRVKATTTQVKLSKKQRQQNLHKAFSCNPTLHL